MIKGKQSIAFNASPYIEESASVVGKKEGEGPLGSRFDMVGLDDMFGEDTWEKAESSMQKEACQLALGKAHLTAGAIRYLFGGDLLRQGVATSLGVEQLQIPMFGLYGACSTSGEALGIDVCGGRIRRADARSDIQPFRKCRKGVSFSAQLCESETAVCTMDGDRKWSIYCWKEQESCEDHRSDGR